MKMKAACILFAAAMFSATAHAQTATPRVCKATAAAPTNVEGTFTPLSCELDGDLRVLTSSGGSTTPSDNFANPANAQNSFSFGALWDGATWDRARGDSVGGAFVQGNVTHDVAATANPLMNGGFATGASGPAAVTAGDAVRAWHTLNGAYVVAPAAISATAHPGDAVSNASYFVKTPDDSVAKYATFESVFNGTSWDRQRGNTSGTFMQGGIAHDSPVSTQFPILNGGEVRTTPHIDPPPADGDMTRQAHDPYGQLFVRNDHLNRIRCTVTVSTATTIQAVGGSCVAPGAGKSIYITDILFSTNAAGIAADSFNTLKYGTGGTCGAGTTVFWGAFTPAATQAAASQALATPIKIPANNEICWINTTAGSKFLVISGFIAP